MPRLDLFENRNFVRGRPYIVEAAWILVSAAFVQGFIPSSKLRKFCLRLFGAKIGHGVVIKTGVKVKFPWRLSIGDYCWIGESVWIDNLSYVNIGNHVCISQGAFLCTGSHDWGKNTFDLITKEINLKNGCWIGAMSKVCLGVTMGERSVLTIGSVAISDIPADNIVQGNPANFKKLRQTDY